MPTLHSHAGETADPAVIPVSTDLTETPHRDNTVTWRLISLAQEGAIHQEIAVAAPRIRVGRQSDAELSLPDPAISRWHAEIVPSNNSMVLVRDLESTNGTFVNGRRVHGLVFAEAEDIIQFAHIAFKLERAAGIPATVKPRTETVEWNPAVQLFDMLIDQPGVIPYYQPILSFSTGEPIGFEMLARSRLKGLESPTAMFSAAANLARVAELSCLLRREGVRLGRTLANGRPIFLNTHPAELKNRSTFTSLEELRKEYPDQPITIEIHEKAVTDTSILHDLRTLLTSLDMKLAFDDFGTGESRLLELAEVTPDVVKFDRSLIKDIHQAPEARVQLIARLVRIIHELNSVTVAEGVELPEESAVCRQIGFQAGQGYAFGRPQPIDGLD